MNGRRAAAAGTVIVATVVASACGRGSRAADSAAASTATDTSASATSAVNTTGITRATVPAAGQGRPAPHPPAGGRQSGPAGPANAMSVRPSGDADTIRGIVRVVGNAAGEQVIVRPNAGGAPITLLGSQSATLGRLSGVEALVSGTRDGTRRMTVERFLVRSVDGVPAVDGTLLARDGGYAIVTTADHAEHPIANPPAALRSHVGARVWITGPLETGAVTFGVISDR